MEEITKTFWGLRGGEEITKTWGISGVDGIPEDMIYLARVCPITNTINEMPLPITEEQYLDGMDLWAAGELIQNAFPMLNADQREFVKTGIRPETWDSLSEDYHDA